MKLVLFPGWTEERYVQFLLADKDPKVTLAAAEFVFSACKTLTLLIAKQWNCDFLLYFSIFYCVGYILFRKSYLVWIINV